MEDHLEHRNKLITEVYHRWYLLLMSKGGRMGRLSWLQDDVATFLEKLCHKTPEEIERFYLSEEATYAKVITAYRNHVIDRIRKENAKKYIKTTELPEHSGAHHRAENDAHLFEVAEIRAKYRKHVEQSFRKPIYLEVFDLIADGLSNEEIAEHLEIKSSKAGSIRHRIKHFLKKECSSMQ